MFKNIYQLIVQKEDYSRIKIYDNDGSVSRTEDEIQIPAFGPSPVPFDCELYVSKENAGDDDTFMFSVLIQELGD